MSFSGTPLGQGRRLDHQTFLNKPGQNHQQRNFQPRHLVNNPQNPQRPIPTSYAYGAPTAATRSPPKVTPSLPAPNLDSSDAQDDTALVRYARLKRDQTLNNLQPEKWAVKDTSVNIAAAFNQAVSTSYEMVPNNPNNVWASGSQTNLNVPRSTSVEYEKETHSTSSRRLAPPPSRLTQRTSHKPLSKQGSALTHVSDSETEEQHTQHVDNSARGKSPFEQVLDISKRAVNTATSFYLRQRSTEPANISAATTNGKESSLDYEELDREYTDLQRQRTQDDEHSASRKISASQRRNRMSLDNKAYRPSMSDLEESDDQISADGKKRRKKIKKRDLGPGTLTSLPVAGYDKRRRRKRGSKGGEGEPDEAEDDQESSIDSEQYSSAQRAPASLESQSQLRTSVPPSSRASVPRTSVPPASKFYPELEDGLSPIQPGLEVILESDEPPAVDGVADTSDSLDHGFIGGILGLLVSRVARFFWSILVWIHRIILITFLMLGHTLASTVNFFFYKPTALLRSLEPRSFTYLARLAVVALVLYLAWFKFYDPLAQLLPYRGSPTPYHPPETPINNLDELVARLQNIESALSGLSLDHQRARAQQDLEARAHGEVVNRIYALEARVREEAKRVSEAETHLQASASHGLSDVKRQIDALHTQLSTIESIAHGAHPPPSSPPLTSDEEAWKKLKLLEDRLGGVEGGVKEALEFSKNAVKDSTPSGPAWWSKLSSAMSSGKGLIIKSTDGTDITGLISHLVDTAVVRSTTRDIVSRADFALHSAGARLIPHLTSSTLEMRPTTMRGTVLSWMTGHGREMGRSPITALHQDTHSGLCWPMSGDFGQLGVALSFPAYITDITIDHVAKEVAFDLRTAPRDMEVWGLVEGKDNLEKVAAFRAEQAAAHAEAVRVAEESGAPLPEEPDEDAYPPTLPANEPFIRLASFTYDIDAPSNIQMFPVRQEIRDLDVDFGIVALVIKNNWGKKEYTCLYRFRVHGERLGGTPQPSILEDS